MIRYALLGAVGAVLFILLFAMPHEKFSLKGKIFASLFVILLIFFAGFFERSNDSEAAFRRDLLLKFEQGGNIRCDKFIINSKTFNYEYGTASFVAKDKNHGGDEGLAGVSVDIQSCEARSEK